MPSSATSFAVAGLLVFALAIPLQSQAPRLSDAVRQELIANGFSGTVLIARDGERPAVESFGVAERAFGAPVTNETRFRIASITKLFTAVLVMQLVERDSLELGAPIARYLADYRGEGASVVTLHQLLTHTSGIQNFDNIPSYEHALAHGIPHLQLPRTPRQLLDEYASGPLVAEPGSRFEYNNGDYVILGQIIERVTGQRFAEALQERTLRPLGLAETTLAEQSEIVPRLATSYFRADTSSPLGNELPVYYENWYASGALYSTGTDVARFADALFGGRLISAESLRMLLTPARENYAYGLWVDSVRVGARRRAIAHRPGRIMGTNTVLLRYLDEGLTVVILANTNLVDTDALAFRIGRGLLEGR